MVEQADARLANLDGIAMHSQLPTQAQIPVATTVESEAYTVPAADDLLEMFDDDLEATTTEAGAEAPAPAGSDAPDAP
jgi:hypothetical protein